MAGWPPGTTVIWNSTDSGPEIPSTLGVLAHEPGVLPLTADDALDRLFQVEDGVARSNCGLESRRALFSGRGSVVKAGGEFFVRQVHDCKLACMSMQDASPAPHPGARDGAELCVNGVAIATKTQPRTR